MTATLDDLLYSALTRGLDRTTVESYAEAVLKHEQSQPETAGAFQTVDAKASGTLTHVSMMIAGLGLVAPIVAKSRIEETIIICQIAVYLLIAIGCLRCLSVFNSLKLTGSDDHIKQKVRRELIIRRELYNACNRVTIAFTIFVFITLPALLIWDP